VPKDAGKDGVITTPFIGPEEERSGRAAAGGDCSFKDGTGEEEVGQRHLDGGFEEDGVALHFCFIHAREGGHRRRAATASSASTGGRRKGSWAACAKQVSWQLGRRLGTWAGFERFQRELNWATKTSWAKMEN
jgi:hypothetical protein